MLPESASQRTLAQQLPYVNDPYIIDIVKVTEDRVAELGVELQQQKKYTDEVETKLANLKYQVKRSKSLIFIIILSTNNDEQRKRERIELYYEIKCKLI